jgi:precorrin-6Y C5,15-methyltransferase (decarboxylating)
VFIGGGARTEGVLDGAWDALKTGGRMVANGVTIETESRLIEAMQAKGGSLGRLSIERQDAIGSLHGFRPALTVTQWTALKP